MNRFTFIALFFLLACTLSGCGRPPEQQGKKKKTASRPGVGRQIAEEITGYRAVKQGRKMQEKLKKIGEEREEDMSRILDSEKPDN